MFGYATLFIFYQTKSIRFGMTALLHLQSLSEFEMSEINLSEESNNKIKSTVFYSLQNNPGQNTEHVNRRCQIATMAEQKVAEHMSGHVMNSHIDFNDPFTYAFDVLSGINYYGTRIEVKTHQNNNRWISVNLDHKNLTGHMNLHHFLEYEAADYITIYTSTAKIFSVKFKNVFTGTRKDVKKIIRKSRYDGWYLHI